MHATALLFFFNMCVCERMSAKAIYWWVFVFALSLCGIFVFSPCRVFSHHIYIFYSIFNLWLFWFRFVIFLIIILFIVTKVRNNDWVFSYALKLFYYMSTQLYLAINSIKQNGSFRATHSNFIDSNHFFAFTLFKFTNIFVLCVHRLFFRHFPFISIFDFYFSFCSFVFIAGAKISMLLNMIEFQIMKW